MFSNQELCKLIRGFEFRTKIDLQKQVSCKIHIYGKFEVELIKKICNDLGKNDMGEVFQFTRWHM